MALLRKGMRFASLAVAVVAPVIALSPTPANAAKGVSGSFSGTTTVHFVTDAPQFSGLCNLTTPCALGSGTATGRLAGVGKVSATGQVAIRFLGGGAFNTAGEATLTANGGTLAVAFLGSGTVTSVGTFVVGSTTESTVTEHILAGTGRFVGVTGTATADQNSTLTAINLGTDCIGAPQSPCLQFTSVDSSIWHDLVLNR